MTEPMLTTYTKQAIREDLGSKKKPRKVKKVKKYGKTK
jgi:hypothetical protein